MGRGTFIRTLRAIHRVDWAGQAQVGGWRKNPLSKVHSQFTRGPKELVGLSPLPGCLWQMKVIFIGIPDPKNVIILVVTGILGGGTTQGITNPNNAPIVREVLQHGYRSVLFILFDPSKMGGIAWPLEFRIVFFVTVILSKTATKLLRVNCPGSLFYDFTLLGQRGFQPFRSELWHC